MTPSDQNVSARPTPQAAEAVTTGTPRAPRDVRTLRRIATAICLVLAPLAVGVVRATIPLASTSGNQAVIAAFAADLALARVELAAGVVAALLSPFAIVGLTRLVARRAPLLALIGGSLALVGWVMLPALVTNDALTYEMARSGANPAQFAALLDHLNGNGAFNLLFTVFIFGHEVGTLLLGVGLWRARVAPLWAAAAVVIGILLHPASFIIGSRLVDMLAFALVTAGCAAAARTVLATPNDAWDLPSWSRRGVARTAVSDSIGAV